jgi:hypothetical protein
MGQDAPRFGGDDGQPSGVVLHWNVGATIPKQTGGWQEEAQMQVSVE